MYRTYRVVPLCTRPRRAAPPTRHCQDAANDAEFVSLSVVRLQFMHPCRIARGVGKSCMQTAGLSQAHELWPSVCGPASDRGGSQAGTEADRRQRQRPGRRRIAGRGRGGSQAEAGTEADRRRIAGGGGGTFISSGAEDVEEDSYRAGGHLCRSAGAPAVGWGRGRSGAVGQHRNGRASPSARIARKRVASNYRRSAWTSSVSIGGGQVRRPALLSGYSCLSESAGPRGTAGGNRADCSFVVFSRSLHFLHSSSAADDRSPFQEF